MRHVVSIRGVRYFHVRRNRPADWPAYIRLRDDAHHAELIHQLDRQRLAVSAATESVAESMRAWLASTSDRAPRTQEGYAKVSVRLSEVLTSLNAASLRDVQPRDLVRAISSRRNARALRKAASALFSHALARGAVDVHPFGVTPRMQSATQRARIEVWTTDDVTAYVRHADALGWHGIGNLLLLMWQTSADAVDCAAWTADNVRDGWVNYTRLKTGVPCAVPLSAALLDRLPASGPLVLHTDGTPYALHDTRADDKRRKAFARLRERVVGDGGRALTLDHLRHSAVTDAVTRGAHVAMIPALTAHRSTAMVERVYSQQTEQQALAVQRARGIV